MHHLNFYFILPFPVTKIYKPFPRFHLCWKFRFSPKQQVLQLTNSAFQRSSSLHYVRSDTVIQISIRHSRSSSSSSSSSVPPWLQNLSLSSLDDFWLFLEQCFFKSNFGMRLFEHCDFDLLHVKFRSHSARCCNGWEDPGGKSLLWVFFLQKLE